MTTISPSTAAADIIIISYPSHVHDEQSTDVSDAALLFFYILLVFCVPFFLLYTSFLSDTGVPEIQLPMICAAVIPACLGCFRRNDCVIVFRICLYRYEYQRIFTIPLVDIELL